MRKIWLAFIALCSLAFFTSCEIGKSPDAIFEAENDWQRYFVQDIKAAENYIREEHPGYLNDRDPGFKSLVDDAVAGAMNRAPDIEGPLGYNFAMAEFSATFRDNHFKITSSRALRDIDLGDAGGLWWPGFITSWRDGRTVVHFSEGDADVMSGDTLLSCDGRVVDDMMKHDIFEFTPHDPVNVANWAVFSPRLMLRARNPFLSFPDTCMFQRTDGTRYSAPMIWKRAPNTIWTEVFSAQFGATPDIGIEEIAPGISWINASTFVENQNADEMTLEELVEQIRLDRDAIAQADAVIFDLTGNQGGNSVWAKRILQALYGNAYAAQLDYSGDVYVEWRAVDANVAKLEEYLAKAEGSENAGYRAFLERTIDGIETAMTKDALFYSTQKPSETKAEVTIQNPVSAHAYVFTSGTCASACLDFMDMVLNIPGATHVGYTTGSDTHYMDVRGIDLPSGYSILIMPMKVFRNRPRESGEFYEPDIEYRGFDWSLETRQEWLLSVMTNEK